MNIEQELTQELARIPLDERETILLSVIRDVTTRAADEISPGGTCYSDAVWCDIFNEVSEAADSIIKNLH